VETQEANFAQRMATALKEYVQYRRSAEQQKKNHQMPVLQSFGGIATWHWRSGQCKKLRFANFLPNTHSQLLPLELAYTICHQSDEINGFYRINRVRLSLQRHCTQLNWIWHQGCSEVEFRELSIRSATAKGIGYVQKVQNVPFSRKSSNKGLQHDEASAKSATD